nr:hypothetical protein [uncultured Mucilaginibacter sp.]
MRVIYACVLLISILGFDTNCLGQKINRQALVKRHTVTITAMDTLGSLTVGNGKFAFTVDATGLQSFPEYYANGVPLGTEAEWGWHSFPNTAGYNFDSTLTEFNFSNKKSLYATQVASPDRTRKGIDYFRQNPHRLQLGNIGLTIIKKDGTIALPKDIQQIHQELNLWTGEINSSFMVEGEPVNVITYSDFNKDGIAVKITSELLKENRIAIHIRFPYPTDEFKDVGVNYKKVDAHQTTMVKLGTSGAVFSRVLDEYKYCLNTIWTGNATIALNAAHDYNIAPADTNVFEFSAEFSSPVPLYKPGSFDQVKSSSIIGWKQFWNTGAAVDLSGSKDPRAQELERRIVLSQYLTRVQCAGDFPPQETGLTFNSWFGKPHMEMYWWHAAHFAQWGRTPLLEKSMQWYFTAFDGAEAIAKRQAYEGVRWQKMTDNNGGETASSIGSFLIWQQPHVIYLSELIYRDKPSSATLQKYKQLVFATADFMASFAHYDSVTHKYNLGKGIIPAQESFEPAETFNSPYELAYWKWALQTAQNWRKRLGMPADKKWQDVIDNLAPMAEQDGLYKAAESAVDSYAPNSRYINDHPAVLAALSTLPANSYVDIATMKRTYAKVKEVWHWDKTWGWDFPMVAMTATRLQQPEEALEALFKNVTTNTYLVNGHNYQDKRLTIYLPGNGSLLSAIALMCAGYDGNTEKNPGFPKNGQWVVRWEGLKKLP